MIIKKSNELKGLNIKLLLNIIKLAHKLII